MAKFNFSNYKDCVKQLKKQGITHLGWIEDGIKLPTGVRFTEVFSNKNNSECIFLSEEQKLCYSADLSE